MQLEWQKLSKSQRFLYCVNVSHLSASSQFQSNAEESAQKWFERRLVTLHGNTGVCLLILNAEVCKEFHHSSKLSSLSLLKMSIEFAL